MYRQMYGPDSRPSSPSLAAALTVVRHGDTIPRVDTIADRIRYLIERGGYASMRDFDRAVGQPADNTQKMLQRGVQRIEPDTLARIAAVGGVSLRWLVTGQGPEADTDAPVIGNLPGWTEAEASVRSLKPRPEIVYQRARQFAALDATVATVDMVLSAVALAEKFPAPGVDTPETAEAKRRIAEIKTASERAVRRRRAP